MEYSQIEIEEVFVDEADKDKWTPYIKLRVGDSTKKEPISAHTGKPLSRFTMHHRVTLAEARAAVKAGIGNGIGYYQHRDDKYPLGPITLIDLDHVIDPLTGDISGPAAAIMKAFRKTYWERSQSKDGAHGYGYGTWKALWQQSDGIEIHVFGFVVVTGDHLPGTPLHIAKVQLELNRLHDEHLPSSAVQHKFTGQRPTSILPDLEVIRRVSTHERYRLMWEGKWRQTGQTDRSRADIDFVGYLVAMGCPAEQIDRVFRASGMYRPKWDEVHDRRGGIGKTYGQMTIECAMKNTMRRF